MQDMQAKQQEVQTVLNGLSDDVKELMAQRDSEILAAAQAEEAARKLPLPRLPRTRTIPTRVVRARVVDRTRPELRSRMPARASSRLSSTRATPRLRRVRLVRGVGHQCLPYAGVGYFGGNACDMFNAWCYSSDRSALQVGMIVADSSHSGTGIPGLIYGHVASTLAAASL